MYYGDRLIITIGYKYNSWKILYLIATEGGGSKKMILSIYTTTLASSIIFPFVLLFRRLCLSYLDPSMELTHKKTQPFRFSLVNVLGRPVWLSIVIQYSFYWGDFRSFMETILMRLIENTMQNLLA